MGILEVPTVSLLFLLDLNIASLLLYLSKGGGASRHQFRSHGLGILPWKCFLVQGLRACIYIPVRHHWTRIAPHDKISDIFKVVGPAMIY